MNTTGRLIYESIKKLHEERKEINSALDEVQEDTLPYKLLSEALQNKDNEIAEMQNKPYTIGRERA